MKKLLLLAGLATALTANLANADTLAAGSIVGVSSFDIADQHDNLQQINTDTQAILFSRDMSGNGIIKDSLAQVGGTLPANWVYIADISGMPDFITKFIAIPRMKALSYPIALDKNGKVTYDYPYEERAVSLIKVQGLRVVDVQYFYSSDKLVKALES